MTSVPGPFTPGVVCMTPDAMPSPGILLEDDWSAILSTSPFLLSDGAEPG